MSGYTFHNRAMPSPQESIDTSDATPDRGSQHYILGTAGHIDHGKTSLIKALTGTNTDRLPEEQRRGMTIELGFAELSLGDAQFGIVDVPGHERFVRTMVAGASGIDLALIVVAADDSIMPQTVEHVEILHLLGVKQAIVAITKTDMVEADMVEYVIEDVRELLASTPLVDAPICPVSSTTGEGIPQLLATLARSAKAIPKQHSKNPFRLAVDRVFTVKGRGTVVTGSLLRGSVEVGQSMEIWPGGVTCRVRDLQSHGVHFDSLGGGRRAAFNIGGVDREALDRGYELATPGYLQPTRVLDVSLKVLEACKKAIKTGQTVRLGMGTRELPARVVLLEHNQLEAGGGCFAQLRCGDWLVASHGQRFIIRDENASRTIGGGLVLRPLGRRRRNTEEAVVALERLQSESAEDRIEQVLRDAGFARPSDLQICARAGVELDELDTLLKSLKTSGRWAAIPGADVFVVPRSIDDLAKRLTRWLTRFHQSNPELPGKPIDAVSGWLARMTNPALAKPLFAQLVATKKLKTIGRFACLFEFAPALTAADEIMLTAIVDRVRTGDFQPPSMVELGKALDADNKRLVRLITLAVAVGDLVTVQKGMCLHVDTEQQLRDTVKTLVDQQGAVTVAQLREALGSSRKYVVPFLEYLDRIKFTRRIGDERVLVSAPSRER